MQPNCRAWLGLREWKGGPVTLRPGEGEFVCKGICVVETIDKGSAIRYQDYRFGRARQRFRGPMPDLTQPYIAFIGGSETYGKFVHDPYPAQVAKLLNMPAANWGTPGAGPSFFLKDPVLLEACSNAEACVVSVMGAVSMSNRLYTVFKRRNCRVRSTTESLQALYPTLNLSEFRFAHNMLRRMFQKNPENFRLLEIELRQAWVARMRELLDDIETIRVLLWMSTRTPDEGFEPSEKECFVTPPAFVTRDMLEEIAPMADLVIEYVAADSVGTDTADGRIYDPDVDVLAATCPGQTMHDQAAGLIAEPLKKVLASRARYALAP